MRASVEDITNVFASIVKSLTNIKDYLCAQDIDVIEVDEATNIKLTASQVIDLTEKLLSSALNNEYDEETLEMFVAGVNHELLERCKQIQDAFDDFEFERAVKELRLLKKQLTQSRETQ